MSIFSVNTNIPPSSPGMGRVSFPSHDCLEGTVEFHLCDRWRESTHRFCQTELPSKIRLRKEALFLSLSRRWLELFHENNFTSFTQM